MDQIAHSITTVLIVGMVLGVPLMGLTLRFSLKPLVDAFIRLREAQLGVSEVTVLRERVAVLERVLEAHGLMDERRALPLHSSNSLPTGGPLKDRERV